MRHTARHRRGIDRIAAPARALVMLSVASAAFSTALALSGCTKILGDDFRVLTGASPGEDGSVPAEEDAPQDDAAVPFDGPDTGPPCRKGQFHCEGPVLQRCDDAEKTWVNTPQPLCASVALCDDKQGVCRPPACQAGKYDCSGNLLRVCNDSLTAWSVAATCRSAAYCNATRQTCTTAPCNAGEWQCSGAAVQQCAPDESGWQTKETCDTPGLCSAPGGGQAARCVTAACKSSEYRCRDGIALEQCNDRRTGWDPVSLCETRALCDSGAGVCKPPVCQPNEYHCDPDGTLRQCAAGRDGFEFRRLCAGGAAYCDANTGSCAPQPCQLGSYQCNGAALETCADDGAGAHWRVEQVCETSALCHSASPGCDAPVCGPGTSDDFCSGTKLFSCNAGRTGFTPTDCGSSELCDPTASRCNKCVPSSFYCIGSALHQCTLGGQLDSNAVVVCMPPTICDATAPGCAPQPE